MKVILRTNRRPAKVKHPNTGETLNGELQFEVSVYSAGEEGSVWPGSVPPSTAAHWLRQESGQATVVIPPPPPILDAPPVEVPAAALRALPSDALVAMEWIWEPTK